MAKHVIKNPTIELDGERLEKRARSVSFTRVAGEVECTNAKSGGKVERIAGLFDGSCDIDWQADFADTGADSKVFDTLKDLLGTKVTLKVDPTAGNMQDEGEVEVLITELPLFDGAIGELSTFSTSWPFSGEATFTLPPPTPLYTGKMVTGFSGTYSGFNRHSTPGTHFGQLDEQRPAGLNLADDTDETRIIALYLNSAGNGSLFVRTNKEANLEGKWLEVDDQYIQMTGFSSGDADIPLAGSTTWTGDAWVVGSFLPWAVYDRDPTGSAALATPTSERVARLGMTIATSGTERGFLYASGSFSYGGPTDPTNRQITVPDATVTMNKCAYDTSGGGEWEINASNNGGAVDLRALWFRVVHQVGSGTATEIAKGRIIGNSGPQATFSTVLGEVPSAPDPIATWNANTTDWFLEFWLGQPT